MSIKKTVNPLIRSWLEYGGFTPERINKCTSETSLMHDLDIYGDDADELLLILHDKFGVDMSAFDNIGRYFPSETSLILGFLSWLRLFRFGRKHTLLEKFILNKYPKLTLGMIEEVIKNKKRRL